MSQASKLRDALRRMGNPYATLDAEAQVVEAPALTADAIRREQFVRGENPCAWDYYFDKSALTSTSSTTASIAESATTAPGLSQAQFEQRARAIFRTYIPAEEKGRLRTHHRSFITRNRARSPQVRFQLIAGLSKYDLTGTPGISSQFNRERDALTEAKLSQIENSVEERN